jgi:hypothetical protein
MISIKAYRAIDDLELCKKYALEHRRVLESFNLTNISTNNIDWAYNPDVYVVVAFSEKNGHLLGGIRIQIANGIMNLPVEDAVSHFDPKIKDLVKQYSNNGGTGEICGLWNSREEAPNMGITLMLVLAGLAISSQLKINSLFTIVASYTLKIALQVGFKIEKDVGINGEFIYPNSNYVARVLSMDPHTLENTYQVFKNRILTLRENEVFNKIETTPKGDQILVKYDLKLHL